MSVDAASCESSVLIAKRIPGKNIWEERRNKQIALGAALKMSSVGESEKRLIDRAKVIFDFLYGSEESK
jgi:hypothetical protein